MDFHECVLNNVTRDHKILSTKYNCFKFPPGIYLDIFNLRSKFSDTVIKIFYIVILRAGGLPTWWWSSSVICQTTGPKSLPKRFLHIVRSRASSFNWEYPLLSLRLSSNFLRLLPRLLVTSICPFIFPSITCCRR